MWKKIAIGLVGAIAALAVTIQLRPDQYEVSRSVLVAATPAAAHELVNDFHKWDGWSPWAKLDPAMKVTYSGPTSGVGAAYYWVGNSDVGEGKMKIRESKPGERVGIDLEFLQPFPSTSDTVFTFTPEGTGTRVKWNMSGKSAFMTKAMDLFIGMDSMIGKDFEKGLSQLKQLAESSPKPVEGK